MKTQRMPKLRHACPNLKIEVMYGSENNKFMVFLNDGYAYVLSHANSYNACYSFKMQSEKHVTMLDDSRVAPKTKRAIKKAHA